MAQYDPQQKPRLRPVEARPAELEGAVAFLLSDPTDMAEAAITVTEPALFILSQFDGATTLDRVRDAFAAQFGQPLPTSALAELVENLDQARLLAGESFERYYAQREAEYLAAPLHEMYSAEALGLNGDASTVVAEMLAAEPTRETVAGRVVGLVAPHLDYPRGRVCYSAAYSELRDRPAPRRVVVLGTNHFGRSASVAASGKDRSTPLGVTRADRAFLERLEARCGNLRAGEFDHEREHSVDLQVLICQHLWGADGFELVAAICPDPCGPSGTAPADGCGVDLRDFATALRAEIDADGEDTLVIAGADLSHVGIHFGDEQPIDDAFCAKVHDRDAILLGHLAANHADDLLAQAASDENPTRLCSTGCIFITMSVLPDAQVRVLRYHQAVDDSAQIGVTCAAAVFTV